VKEPGLGMELAQSELELLYMQKYSDTAIPEAYERLILDCINGGARQHASFASSPDESDAC